MSTDIQIRQRREALDSIAADIKARHESCDIATEATINAIHGVMLARVEVAQLVEAARSHVGSGIAFAKWWRDAGLPFGWAVKYLRLARSAKAGIVGDKSQLRLAGILPEAESGNEGHHRQSNPYEWTKWVGKVRSTLTVDSVRSMGLTDRLTIAKQLEPLIAIYEECKKQ